MARKGQPCRGIVFLVHGYATHFQFEWLLAESPGGEHTCWMGSVPQGLVDAGYIVLGIDQQSFGRSEGLRGLRGYFEDFDDLARENLEFLKLALSEEHGTGDSLPLFVFGISMGGATAVRMVQMRPQIFGGMVLYAPMLSLEALKKERVSACITNGHVASVGSFLSRVTPTLPVAKPARFLKFPLKQKEMDEDKLAYHGDIRARVGEQNMSTTERFMQGGLESVSVPFVTFHAVDDTFTDPLGSQKLVDVASSTDKTYLKVGLGQHVEADLWHQLTTEPGHEIVFQHALEWIQKRTSSQEDAV